MPEQAVNEDHIASVVSRWTAFRSTKCCRERQKLLDMESALHARVVGQDAVSVVVRAGWRARAGRPDILRQLFVSGPTGVETELTGTVRVFV